MPKYFVLIHPQTPSDPIQTLPDTIQTPQDIGIFMQYREEKAISEYHDLYIFLTTDLVLMPPQTPSDTIQLSSRHPQTPSKHHPDTLRHHPDTPKHRRFYAIEGTGRKGNIRVWPISNFSNGFGIATS